MDERSDFDRKRSDGDRAAVKLREREAGKGLVEVPTLVTQDADRDFLAEQESLRRIRTPVNALDVAAQGNIVGELVQFVAYCLYCLASGL